MKYDFIVIGAGIAGIAISELLQRSGKKVLLLEEKEKVGSCSSAEQQGWFHTGALYAALPTKAYFKALVANLDNIFNYYSVFSRMNLERNRHLTTAEDDGWFNNSLNYYCYTNHKDASIPFWHKLIWLFAISRAQGRLAWFESLDFSKNVVPQMDFLNFSLDFDKVLNKSLHTTLGNSCKVLASKDRTMNSEYIIADLINSYVSHGGEVRLNSKVLGIENNKVVTASDSIYYSNNIILSAGKGIKELTSLKVNVVASPLLVVKPAIINSNLIKMHPVMTETINHIYHNTSNGNYSVIGSATYYDSLVNVDSLSVHSNLLNNMNNTFMANVAQNKTTMYFGYKTELANYGQLRNYHHHIVKTENCIAVLPGKMTLAFSLAVDICRLFGIKPSAEFKTDHMINSKIEISKPLHYYEYLQLP